tara:strand:+ start:818 stop:1693 length:876 start_codon:yes stop_codon:yes gene_type:complete
MDVEIIEQASSTGPVDLTPNGDNDILDLTGSGPDEVVEEVVEEPTEEVLDLVEEVVEEPTEEVLELVEEEDDTDYFFGEDKVNVEVPDEIQAALKDADIDQEALLGQLFAKDGDFTLDEATRAKLDDKFGKLLVDGYLNMYKGINEQAKVGAATEKAAVEALQTKQNTEYAEAVGGEEGLVAMETYVLDNLSEGNLDAYNAVMESDNHAAQLLIISQVKTQMELADKLANGDQPSALIGDGDASGSLAGSPLEKGYLTSNEYQTIMESEKYWDDPNYAAQVDSARKAGFNK